MHAFEAIIVMLLAAVVLLRLSARFGAPYPTMLAIAGAALAASPIKIALPFHLDPELALALFVAPVLLDTAYDTSVRDLKRSWKPVLGLVLFAVVLTTLAVAAIAHWLVPQMPWSAAIALGAIVAPPDAAAATSILRQVNLPHRIRVILEGESLLNDASSLLIYRLAVMATVSGGAISAEAVAPTFLLAVVGSVVAGPALAFVSMRITHAVDDAPSSIIFQFSSTFAVWLIAEAAGLSAVLTVVLYAITVARFSPARMPARLRVPSYAVWDTAVVVLTALAFLMIGLELGTIVAQANGARLLRWTVFAGVVLATAIAIRMAWALIYNTIHRVAPGAAGLDLPPGQDKPTWRGGLIIGWTGMRGIVTVAAALALPGNFPERDLILFTAFAVTLGTLVLQGFTLKPLVRAFALDDEHPVEREIRKARVALADVSLATIDGDGSPEARIMRDDYEIERRTAEEAETGDGRPVLRSKVLRARVLEARRARLLALRQEGTIGDDAFHRLEEELDFADLATAQRT